jgi:hypothetical protein
VPRDVLLARLLHGLRRRLKGFNRDKPLKERLRLRVAFHGGDVLRDPAPFEGTATVLACRLLNADVLRACLRATSEPLAAIASQPLHDGIIRHGYQRIDPAGWHPVVVATKEGPQPAWVHVPGDPGAPVRAQVVAA